MCDRCRSQWCRCEPGGSGENFDACMPLSWLVSCHSYNHSGEELAGININFVSLQHGQTALMLAVCKGLERGVHILVANGADVNRANPKVCGHQATDSSQSRFIIRM